MLLKLNKTQGYKRGHIIGFVMLSVMKKPEAEEEQNLSSLFSSVIP